MNLRLFGRRSPSRDPLVLAWADQALAYVQAHVEKNGVFRVQRFGVLRQGTDSPEDFARKLAALGLRGLTARVMLRPSQYQILQIEAPAVAPEELRTAARWQIREMVDRHVDDLTLDVLKVGDDQTRSSSTGGLFVVTAANVVIREVMQMAQAARCTVEVVDIQDLAQRNLQTALARSRGRLERAHAAIVIGDDNQALLTISAREELFYTRRIDLGAGFMQAAWGAAAGAADTPDLELSSAGMDTDRIQRLVVEIQRSLDLWDRTWPMLALDSISAQAGARTGELANRLGQELGHTVQPMEVTDLFPGFEGGTEADRQLCWPLLGALLRTESRRL